MILGYEQPVDIPVMSMYDKDMMKMYLGALREDYQQGLEDQKEFNKMASEFYSPIAKDNDTWYNLTTKPIVEYLNQNPDAIRSVEGRAAIRQFINSRPYQDMAKLRQSADMAKTYNDLKAKLKAAGKYSDDLERTLGVGDLATWDTLKNGVWNTESPTEMKDLYSLTHDRFDPLAKMDFDLGPGRDIYHRRKGVEEKHMTPIVDQALDGIRNTPYYKLFLERYGNDDGIRKAIIDVNRGVLHDSEITDEVELAKLKEAGENARARMARASKESIPEPTYSVTTQMRNDSVAGLGYNNMTEYMSNIASKAADKIKDAEKKKGKALSQVEKNNIISNVERREQQNAIKKYYKSGYSWTDSILKAGTSTAPLEEVTYGIFGSQSPDKDGYYTLTANQKRNLLSEAEVLQRYARKQFRKNVKKLDMKKVGKAKVDSSDNQYRVFNPETNMHEFYTVLTDAYGTRMYLKTSETFDPRGATGQGVDANHIAIMQSKPKTEQPVEGND